MLLLAAQAEAASPASGDVARVAASSEAPPRSHPGSDPPQPESKAAPAPDPVCESREQQGQIVICAPRPQGYRLNPDVMEAKRAIRRGGLKPPEYRTKDNSCATVGPMGCFNAGINLLAAAATAAEMAKRLAEGKEVGSLFVTDPHPDEYQLYQMAKAMREAREAEAATAAKVKAAEGARTKPVEPSSPAKATRPQAQPSQE